MSPNRSSTPQSALSAGRRMWRALPEGIRDSAPARMARRTAVGVITGTRPEGPRVIRTLAELDEMIARLEQAVRTSDDELRRGFRSFRMELDRPMPADPFSPGYRRAVLELYEWLHGSPYSTDNESTAFDMGSALVRPFPYLTGSPETVGDYLIAVGHLVRTVGLGPGSRVLELGPGWGNVAVPLAQLGCQVTVVDVSPQFVDLVAARAGQVGVEIDARVGDFSSVEQILAGEKPFDAVVFFESFHHCVDHNALLEKLGLLVSAAGRLVLAAEPVERRFWKPWGIRLDGESLWAVRRNGWLELGFRRDYFLEALRRAGWRPTLVACPATPWGQAWVARHA